MPRVKSVKVLDDGGWLWRRFGSHVAQISNDTTIRLKMAIRDVFRAKYGHVPGEILKLTTELPDPPVGISDRDWIFGYHDSDGAVVPGIIDTDDTLQSFVKNYGPEWEVVQLVIGLHRQKSRHASAYIITHEPVSSFIPMTTVGGVRVTQLNAAGCEAMGALKMDFLVVKTLNYVQEAIRLIQDRHGKDVDWAPSRAGVPDGMPIPSMAINGCTVPHIRCVPYGGTYYDIWALPEQQQVFNDICEGHTESIFQFDSHSAREWLPHFDAANGTKDGVPKKALHSIETLAAFTALDRPGGLDAYVETPGGQKHNMLVEFAVRAKGGAPNGDPELNATLLAMFPETYGVLCYQEQMMRAFQVLGDTSGQEADEFRTHTSKKQMKKVMEDREIFMRGAIPKLGESVAQKLWDMLFAFSRYGFCKAHAVSYVTTSYACAWLKHWYPLEWWTAVLSNSDRNKITEKLWAHCNHLVELPKVTTSGHNFCIVGSKIQAPLNFLKGVADKAQEQVMSGAPYTDLNGFVTAIQKWRLDNSTMVKKKKVDKKTGEESEVLMKRLATSAVNSRVIKSLIVTGALDPLFSDVEIEVEGAVQRFPMTLEQKFAAYEEADAQAVLAVTGKKKPKKKNGIQALSPLGQYQAKKEVLPVIMEPLFPLARPLLGDRITKLRNDVECVVHRASSRKESESYPVASGYLVRQISGASLNQEVVYCAVAFVADERRWKYSPKDPKPGQPKTKQACELQLEVDSEALKSIYWSSGSSLPQVFDKELKGAVVLAFFRKRPNKQPGLEDIVVLQEPLSATQETTPEDEHD